MQLDQAKDGDTRRHGSDERREEAHLGQIDARNRVIIQASISHLNSKDNSNFKSTNLQERKILPLNFAFIFRVFHLFL